MEIKVVGKDVSGMGRCPEIATVRTLKTAFEPLAFIVCLWYNGIPWRNPWEGHYKIKMPVWALYGWRIFEDDYSRFDNWRVS